MKSREQADNFPDVLHNRNLCIALVLVTCLASCAAAPTNGVPRTTEATGPAPTSNGSEPLNKTEFIERHLPDIKRNCFEQSNTVVRIADRNVLCLFGRISATAEAPKEQHPHTTNRSYSIAYVRSPGGAGQEAMAIGKELFDNAAYLIVDGPCHSSCGNYLIPAARRLYMTDGSIISMHGSLTRNRYKFARLKIDASTEAGQKPSNTAPSEEFRLRILRELDRFDQYVTDSVVPELEYFVSIKTDEAYVTRFYEVRRTLDKRESYRCKPDQGLYLIVGPRYLKEFGIRTIREWFPEDLQTYVRLMPNTKDKYSFIFDFDDHPFWHSSLGAMTPATCSGDAMQQAP